CHLPVVVVSANAHQGYEELQGGSFAIVDVLQKPIDQAQLLEAVGRAVRQKVVNTPRILHVEDDPDILQVVATILRDVAIVCPAATMQEASQILRQERFDLVILDLNMPDGSGLHLLPHLNCNGEPVPVVVFSAQEVGLEIAQQVTAALVKSRTSNQELLDTIKALISPGATA
ncbi:MAG: response regulator, partial [Leptolyngbyaceae cyanobacterium bins.59]|nr:response regulator [Leptolyngbyaceae cyanobacterium bins.59]